MSRSLYPREKSPRYPMDRRFSGPQNRSGHGGEEKSPCPCRQSNLGRPARSLDTVLIELQGTHLSRGIGFPTSEMLRIDEEEKFCGLEKRLRPMRCPSGPKMFVRTRKDKLAGRRVTGRLASSGLHPGGWRRLRHSYLRFSERKTHLQ